MEVAPGPTGFLGSLLAVLWMLVSPNGSVTPPMPTVLGCPDAPVVELIIDGPQPIGEATVAVLEDRIIALDPCSVTSTRVAEGQLHLFVRMVDDPLALVGPLLAPGDLSVHPVLDDVQSGAPAPPGASRLPLADGSGDLVVSMTPGVGPGGIAEASAEISEFDDWVVNITFTNAAGETFAELTRKHIGRALAIVLDGEVLSAPRVHEPILGGRAMISGGFIADEARTLAALLTAGPLPPGLQILSIR